MKEYFKNIESDASQPAFSLLKVNNRNSRTRCETCLKLIKTPEPRHGIVLVSLLLTLSKSLVAKTPSR